MEIVLLLIFPALLIAAGSFDVFTMTIPNWLTALVGGSFFVFAFAFGMPLEEIGHSVIVAFGVLLVTMGMFGLGWFGGGDAKLMTACALWIGIANFPAFLLGVCLIGGVATLAIVAFRRIPLPGSVEGVSWVARLHSADEGVPYGVAIAGAGVFLFSNTELFRLIIG
ncbi:MAG: peptidase [Alphaproteobacteria bacterium]|nr:MAG: peptidase [Alphaproteobacteria bacterium]